MEIQVNGKVLNEVLKTVKPFVDTKNKKLPIMHTIKITASDAVYITATNLKSNIVAKVPGASVLKPGEVCINHKEFQQLVKGYRDLVLITDKSIKTSIEVEYLSFSPEEFPPITEITDGKDFTLTKEFIAELNTCIPFASDDPNRPLFQTIWIDDENLFSTDTRILILRKQDYIKPDKDIAIPIDNAKSLVSAFKKSEKLNCKLSDNHIKIYDGTYAVTTFIHSDWFKPKYDQVIPKNNVNTITVNTKEFKTLINNFPNEYAENGDKRTFVYISLNESVTMKTNTVKEFKLKCTVNIKERFDVVYDNELLKKIINVFTDEELTINFTGRLGPIVISNEQVITLLSPIRTN